MRGTTVQITLNLFYDIRKIIKKLELNRVL